MIGYRPITIGGSDKPSPGRVNVERTERLVVEAEQAIGANAGVLIEAHYPFGQRADAPAIDDFVLGERGLDWLTRLARSDGLLVYLGNPAASAVIAAYIAQGLVRPAAERIAACVRRCLVGPSVTVAIDAATEATGALAEALRIGTAGLPVMANGLNEEPMAFRTERLMVEDYHVLSGKFNAAALDGSVWYNAHPPSLYERGVFDAAAWTTPAGLERWQAEVGPIARRLNLTLVSWCARWRTDVNAAADGR